HPQTGALACQPQLPWSGGAHTRIPAIDADPHFGQRNALVSPPVGGTFEATLKLQARHRRTVVVTRFYLNRRAASGIAPDMSVNAPVSRVLIVGGCNLTLVGKA